MLQSVGSQRDRHNLATEQLYIWGLGIQKSLIWMVQARGLSLKRLQSHVGGALFIWSLAGAKGSISKMAHSHGWRVAHLSSFHMDLSMRTFECPQDMVAAFLHRRWSEKRQGGSHSTSSELVSKLVLLYCFISRKSLSPFHT